jgi:hypothetical protein
VGVPSLQESVPMTMTARIASTTLLTAWIICTSIQSSHAQTASNETWWQGTYSCAQGQTDLRLKTRSSPDGTVEALFEFGPFWDGKTPPIGSFLLKGSIRNTDGFMLLDPVRWISQPPGYDMVGLAGLVSEDAYYGSVVGARCGEFFASRLKTESTRSIARKSNGLSEPPNPRTLIRLRVERGTFTVPISINNRLTLNFVLDSGAADVSIPADVVLTLIRTGTLNAADFLGKQLYRLADGSTVRSQTFRLRTLRAGDRTLENLTGSVAPVEGSLLLGHSFLSRFNPWSIDNSRRVLVLE